MYDVVSIKVQGGKGGNGAVSFRHEKYVPFGGPDGGDGGDGGSVVIQADPTVSNFKMFRQGGSYRAGDGDDGKGKKKSGKKGENLILKVPAGTIIFTGNDEDRNVIADLEKAGDSIIVAVGGEGGRGNVHYTNPVNQTPLLAQVGEEGEKKTLFLEMRLIADVGIIGYPNVGKSSLLAAASRAHPKVADYPFTTREPELGVVEVGKDAFLLAEIPGLIEGASQGRGLGYDFLRHSLRTRVFIHLIDGAAGSPVENMIRVNNELHVYDPDLLKRPQIVAVNKIDLPEVRERIPQMKADFTATHIAVSFISAVSGEGVRELMKTTADLLKKTLKEVKPPAIEDLKVFRPQPKKPRVKMNKKGTVFIIEASDIERVVARVDLDDATVMRQLRALLVRKGIVRELEKMGIKPGDKVRCGPAEWEW